MIQARWKITFVLSVLAIIALFCLPSPQNAVLAQPHGGGPGGGGPGGGNGGNQNQNQNQQGNGQANPQGRGRRGNDLEAQLGKAIFFDQNISSPAGQSCSSCHAPETGFSAPDSFINNKYGTVPGAVDGRFGNRKPMTISYSWFTPDGPTLWRRRQRSWAGGFFADGRANSLEEQAGMPMVNPNEMNNLVHGLPDPDRVVRAVSNGSYTDLFKQAFGDDALTQPPTDVFIMIREALAAFEQSRDVSPFSSKYDAVNAGEAQFTPSELNGLRLFTGSTTGRPGGPANARSAECVSCHTIAETAGNRRDFFTNWTYVNIGVPRNPHNPFYRQTIKSSNPQGYNPDGDHYVDLGLGAVLYPKQKLPPGNIGPGSDGRGDFLIANGEFRVPSLRNVDKRPYPTFVKAYMHNGVFKSLKEVVHFYNTRNLTRTGEIIDLTSPAQQANLKSKPLWPPPEVASAITLQNPTGLPNAANARVGNLGLTPQEEADIVAFLGTLSDGYFTPQTRRPAAGN